MAILYYNWGLTNSGRLHNTKKYVYRVFIIIHHLELTPESYKMLHKQISSRHRQKNTDSKKLNINVLINVFLF